MARETDFLMLYRILDLNADCGLDEFKLAYRRRVAVLHPDRRPDGPTKTITAERLQHLTAMYSSALEFQRQHGRLPGAAQARTAAPEINILQAAAPSPAKPPERRSKRRLLLLPAAAAAVWLLWPAEEPSTKLPVLTDSALSRAGDRSDQAGAALPPLMVGMHSAIVRAREGAPTMMIRNETWEFGPSWIRFENDKVVDWYSSPLHPLHAATTNPAGARE